MRLFGSNLKPAVPFPRYLQVGGAFTVATVALAWLVGWQLVAPAAPAGRTVAFTIEAGQGVHQVSANLKAAKLIRSQFWFESWVWTTGTDHQFVAGEYHLPSQVNLVNLVRLLTNPAIANNEVSLRLIEGWTARQMGEYLEAQGFASAQSFSQLVNTPSRFSKLLEQAQFSTLQAHLAPPTLEGYLFPDTYRLYRQAALESLVLKMLTNFTQKFAPAWRQQLAAREITLNQAVILASIVEREVQSDEDRAMVADIFWRRLQVGQALQADSTINYVTGKGDPAVSAQDLSLNSPYNTYRYRGLPPGPISNPGESALRAVVYPRQNPYWYFLTTPQSKVIYSKTFAEHTVAKQRYLK